jgi:hypothetical protein
MAFNPISPAAFKFVPGLVNTLINGARTVAGNFSFPPPLASDSTAPGSENASSLQAHNDSISLPDSALTLLDKLRTALSSLVSTGEQLELAPDGFGGITLNSDHSNRVAIETTINQNAELVDELYQHWGRPEFADIHELDRTLDLRF